MIRQSGEHVHEPSLRIDIVEFGGLDQRVDGGGAMAAFVRACEGPVLSSDRDAAHGPLGRVVGHAEAAIVEEAGERGPTLEAVVDRLGGLVLGGELGALLRSQISSSATSGRLRSLRTARRCSDESPLISRSMANRASMRSTDLTAIGAFCSRARSKFRF
jgi:hypothetical protein